MTSALNEVKVVSLADYKNLSNAEDTKPKSNQGIYVSGLYNSCPEQFKRQNEWSEYVKIFIYMRPDSREIINQINNWFWRSDLNADRSKQKQHFFAVLGAEDVLLPEKLAVLGYLLSQMLRKCPVLELQSAN